MGDCMKPRRPADDHRPVRAPHRLWATPRPWAVTGMVLLLAGALTAGCSKSSVESSAGGASFDELRLQVETARDAALAVGADRYAPDPFKRGVSALERANEEASLNEPNASKARTQFGQARRYFDTAASEADKNRKRVEKVEKQKQEFEALLAEKEKAELPLATLDKAGLEEAQSKFREAVGFLEEMELLKAENKFRAALSDLKDSISKVERQLANQAKAHQQKERAATARQRALEAKAREIAPGDIGYAESQEVLAQQHLDSGQYDLASQYYESAETYYNTAFTTASSRVATTPSSSSESDPAQQPRETYRPAPTVERIPPPDKTGEGVALEGTDWLLRRLHGSPEISNGMLRLTYGIGQGPDLRADLLIHRGAQFIAFEGNTATGTDQYLMGGNTQGFVELLPVFRDQVRMEVEFWSQLILPNEPTFQMLLMSGNKNYYGTHFATNLLIRSAAAGGSREIPSPIERFRRPVKNWLTKYESHKFLFEYNKKSDEERGLLRVTFDEEEVAQFQTDFLRTGRVGFMWNNCKWYITSLSVVGRIDEAWLAEASAKGAVPEEATGDDDPFGF